MDTFSGWAPPLMWGPWVEVDHLFGTSTYKISFKTQSNAKSSFQAEIEYWNGQWQTDSVSIPGSGEHSFTAGNCVCSVRVRMKSHSLGQTVRIERNTH
ncbi:hypothetical protein A9Q99_14805 [Gammaproteobacteria bacterium 45_16_T64]|nr:hypothetical protein A9Q99_14805 [Gammaproteobacteria bacterium 45_16_T64]